MYIKQISSQSLLFVVWMLCSAGSWVFAEYNTMKYWEPASVISHLIIDSTLEKDGIWLPPSLTTQPQIDSFAFDPVPSYLTVVTIPADVEIYADSLFLGKTPLKIYPLSKMTLKKRGYEESEIDVTGLIGLQEFDLIKIPANGSESFLQSNTFPLVTAAIIIFGGAAAYLKIQADKNFDEYQLNAEGIYLDRTREYDLYSGIAFGVMQINFGYLIYRFLVTP